MIKQSKNCKSNCMIDSNMQLEISKLEMCKEVGSKRAAMQAAGVVASCNGGNIGVVFIDFLYCVWIEDTNKTIIKKLSKELCIW